MNAETAPVTVRVESLTRTFADFTAVDNVSFEIRAGEIWGFLGPNGAGKSTTIRMLCGVMEPTSGKAEVLGYDVVRDPEEVKLRIGYMTQGSNLWNDLSVEEYLRFYAGLFDLRGAAQDAAVAEWMERVGLTPYRRELSGELSGGYRKRLALAGTLLHQPKMLFLDEPTSGVDPVTRRDFWDLIVSFADEGTTVMVSTHYMDEAEHCNKLAFIFGGRLIAQGSPAELKRGSNVGHTVEIRSADPIPLLNALDGEPYVLSSALYGSALHVTLRRRESEAQLRSVIAAKGFAVDSLSEVTPSLEDVFAALMVQS